MPRARSIALLPWLLAGCGGGAMPSIPSGTEIATAQGTVVGSVDGTTRSFRGIPYAAPPVGDNRFRPPRPPAAWSGKRAATRFGPPCPQFQVAFQGGAYDDRASEDCLTLNLWTPAAAASPRPVMVWLHGGAWVLGSGSEATYEGQNLSEVGNVVVVTINYRLGPLGFLAHPALATEDPAHPTSGNYGVADQRAALRWVKENIAGFGGDPANVTLFGESAGGAGVCVHLTAPASRGLFHRAIMESGPCTAIPSPTKATWEAQGEALVRALGCGGASDASVRACLRGKSAREVLSALPLRTEIVFGDGVSWTPFVDGVELPEQPAVVLAAGTEAPVPLVVGANGDEGTLFFKLLGAKVADDAALRAQLATVYPPAKVDALLGRYSSATFPSAEAAAIRLVGDSVVCDARRVARLHAAAGRPAYLYHFTRAFEWILPGLGAFHGAELAFVFRNAFAFVRIKPEEVPLATAIEGYWTRFAAAGDPNAGAPAGAVAWPAYSASADPHLVLDLAIQPGSGLRKQTCDFLDGLR